MTLTRDSHISTLQGSLISDIAVGDKFIGFISLLLLDLPESVNSHRVCGSINLLIQIGVGITKF